MRFCHLKVTKRSRHHPRRGMVSARSSATSGERPHPAASGQPGAGDKSGGARAATESTTKPTSAGRTCFEPHGGIRTSGQAANPTIRTPTGVRQVVRVRIEEALCHRCADIRAHKLVPPRDDENAEQLRSGRSTRPSDPPASTPGPPLRARTQLGSRAGAEARRGARRGVRFQSRAVSRRQGCSPET